MTREELSKYIFISLEQVRTKQMPVNVVHENILKAFDEFNTPDLSQMWAEDIEGQVRNSPTMLIHLARNGWSIDRIVEELHLFLETNYPKQDQPQDAVRKHFFNYIKKRKPQQNESVIDQIKGF